MPSPKTTSCRQNSTGQPPSQPGSDFASLVERYLDGLETTAASENHQPEPPLQTRRQNYPPPQEELDLHGLTAPEAEKAIHRFVTGCRQLRLATLRIITGKGLHSDGPPVLPPVAEATLADLQKNNQVASFRWEQKRRQRSGALIVHLP